MSSTTAPCVSCILLDIGMCRGIQSRANTCQTAEGMFPKFQSSCKIESLNQAGYGSNSLFLAFNARLVCRSLCIESVARFRARQARSCACRTVRICSGNLKRTARCRVEQTWAPKQTNILVRFEAKRGNVYRSRSGRPTPRTNASKRLSPDDLKKLAL